MPKPDFVDLYLGEVLCGRYEVTDYRGHGGFCLVFEAKDMKTNENVALKILSPGVGGDEAVEFATEGELLDRLRKCSHVIDLIGPVNNQDNIIVQKPELPAKIPLPVTFLVLELADACVAELLPQRHSIPWEERLVLYRGVVKGVHQMHLGKVAHRDIKSENILLVPGQQGTTAQVADLGRSTALDGPRRFMSDAYLSGRGDLRFAPPELLSMAGSEEPAAFRRADLFLLGSFLFELATGQGITPIALGNPQQTLTRALSIPPQLRASSYHSRLGDIRAAFEPAFTVFGAELPRVLRHEGTALIRQLCDADPTRRESRYRAERNLSPAGLEWLLRRVDILTKRLRTTKP